MNLTRHELHPATREEWLALRKLDVTSTEVSALFGMSKYMTAYELALVKAGDVEDQFKASERSHWGTAFEDAIAMRVGQVYGVKVRKKSEYMRIIEARMGASFDYEICGIDDDWDGRTGDHSLRSRWLAEGDGLLEIKNVDSLIFKSEWTVGEVPEAPRHIEIQLQQQLHVSGNRWGVIAALVGGNRLELIHRDSDPEVGARLITRVSVFWENLERGIYPDISYPEDAWIVRKLYTFAEPGKLLDWKGDKLPSDVPELVAEYQAAANAEKAATDRKTTAHAKLLQMIGDHERVLTDFATISCGSVAECDVSYRRKAYRLWKITPKKAAIAAKDD